ncbi:MAG: glycosyltransferase family 2 protein [Paludibacter sp.]|nr:glycosyltransferase family 2 protein [Paludibacter sp.]
MKIAAISITYNDDYKLNEWFDYYQFYKDELFLHIIVDNSSSKEYLDKVESMFVDSFIIKRTSNGGCTSAYNDGIRYALANKEVDAIMLIGNDIKLESGGITKCHEFLKSDPKLGMIEPVILKKDSLIIEDFGCEISKTLFMKSYMAGKKVSDIEENYHYAETVTGGLNLASREFYEVVGLQDENLFMYSDEVDMGIRAKKLGYKMAATKATYAWHQHINENKVIDKRHPFSLYLVARNKVYLAKKHFGYCRSFYVFSYFIVISMKNLVIMLIKSKFNFLKDQLWSIFGALNGFLGNMKPNRFSVPN